MKKCHFWYSQKLADLCHSEDDALNRCAIVVCDESVELEYTHCHSRYVANGGVSWDDTVYLGYGDITYIGEKHSMDAWRPL